MLDWPMAYYCAGFAALLGGGMGLLSFLVPRWGASVVRLMPDPRWEGGWAEFRASYGAALFLGHGSILLTLAMSARAGAGSVIGTSFAMGMLWLGMAVGRTASYILDDTNHQTRTGYNLFSIAFELVMAGLLFAPFIAHLGG